MVNLFHAMPSSFFHRNNGILYHICMFFLNKQSSNFPIFKWLGFQATIKIFIGFHDAEKRWAQRWPLRMGHKMIVSRRRWSFSLGHSGNFANIWAWYSWYMSILSILFSPNSVVETLGICHLQDLQAQQDTTSGHHTSFPLSKNDPHPPGHERPPLQLLRRGQVPAFGQVMSAAVPHLRLGTDFFGKAHRPFGENLGIKKWIHHQTFGEHTNGWDLDHDFFFCDSPWNMGILWDSPSIQVFHKGMYMIVSGCIPLSFMAHPHAVNARSLFLVIEISWSTKKKRMKPITYGDSEWDSTGENGDEHLWLKEHR